MERSSGCCAIPHALDQGGWGKTLTRFLCLIDRRLFASSPVKCRISKVGSLVAALTRQHLPCSIPGPDRGLALVKLRPDRYYCDRFCFPELCAGVCFRLGKEALKPSRAACKASLSIHGPTVVQRYLPANAGTGEHGPRDRSIHARYELLRISQAGKDQACVDMNLEHSPFLELQFAVRKEGV